MVWRDGMGFCLCLVVVVLAGCASTLAPQAPGASEAPGGLDAASCDLAAPVLVPAPRTVNLSGEAYAAGTWDVTFEGVPAGTEERIAGCLLEALAPFGAGKTRRRAPAVFAIVGDTVPHAEGYSLTISQEGIRAAGHDAAGLFYAVMTLRQLARQYADAGALPGLCIEDWPDFPHRGVMLDVARCKVPQMETLYRLVDRFAEWKCNELQLYTEHSFAYPGHEVVWKDASPMTPADIRALDAYCRERYVELVPNQNSFGHMNRWLRHKEYRHLAEMPRGGGDLCPVDPRSIALLKSMYAGLLPNFSSRQANVGCDETWSLGKGRSKAACDERGVGRVYFEFLMKIHAMLRSHGRTMQFWGDIIMHHPELIPELPDGIIAMEWGYSAEHPFKEHGRKFAESGVPFYVVPGTSTWNALAGRTDNAMANLRNAAENGLANGAIGYLITDWGDGGHWQFQAASFLPFAYGAGLCWAFEANKDLDVRRAVDVHAFEDSAGAMGRLAWDLGNAYRVCGVVPGNSSIFYTFLTRQVDGETPEGLTAEGLQATIDYIDQTVAVLPNTAMECADAELIRDEFALTADFMRFACRLGIARIDAGGVGTSEVPADVRHRLADELAPLIPRFRTLWRSRNREGGLGESSDHFERLLKKLRRS